MSFLGRPLLDGSNLALFLVDLLIDLTSALIIVGWIYLPSRRDKEHAFMLITLNVVVFFVGSIMSRFQLGLGFAFGLFALFGILRYRTESVPVPEMSYLFALLALAIINGIARGNVSYAELFIANGFIAAILYSMDHIWWKRADDFKTIVYGNIENIHQSKRAQLIADLRDRTGLEIRRVEVKNINLRSGSARVRVYYRPTVHD
jgi:hypothetical protein